MHTKYRKGFEKKMNHPDSHTRYRIRYTGDKLKKLVSCVSLKILECSELHWNIFTVPDILGSIRIVMGSEPLIPPEDKLIDSTKVEILIY